MIPKIYIVSESADNPRINKFYSQFPAHEGYFTVTPAVMGGKLPAAEYYNYMCKNYNKTQRILSPAEVGCALSHLAICKAAANNKASTIIFEDDIIGDDQTLTRALELADYIQPHQIAIIGGYTVPVDKRFIKYQSNGQIRNNKSDRLADKVDPLSYLYLGGACCYIVGHQAAAIIAKKQQECLHVADAWNYFSEGTAIEFYFTQLFGHPVIDENLDSYLAGERDSLIYISSYKLALRNFLRMLIKKKNQIKLSLR